MLSSLSSSLPLIVAGLVVVGALVAWFVWLERRGRPEVVVGLILALTVTESLIFPSQGTPNGGIFLPSVAGQDFRLPQLLIPMALIVRWSVRGWSPRLTGPGLFWGAFYAWYATCAVIGILHGNNVTTVLFHAKSIVLIGGGILLVASVPVERLASWATMRSWALILGVVVAVSIPLSLADIDILIDTPATPDAIFGNFGADVSTVVAAVGIVTLVVEACRERRRPLVALAAMLLVVAPIFGTQRASMVASTVAVGSVLIVALGATWAARSRVTLAEAGLLIGSVALVLGAVVGLRVGFGGELPLAEHLEQTFVSEGRQVAAESRIKLWSQSADLIKERPLLGWGLGKQPVLPRLSLTDTEATEAPAHNVALDTFVRSGFIGLALFLTALTLTLTAGWRAWREHPDPVVAAFALGCLVAIAGVLARGMVESIFEQFRIATLLGLLLGGVLSAVRSMTASPGSLDQSGRTTPPIRTRTPTAAGTVSPAER